MQAMASAVAKKVNGVVITSSPGRTLHARRAKIRALVPLEQPIACFALRYSAACLSKFVR